MHTYCQIKGSPYQLRKLFFILGLLLVSNLAYSIEKGISSIQSVTAGESYSSFKDTLYYNECVSGEHVSSNILINDASLKIINDFDSFQREMGFAIPGAFQAGLAKGTAKANFVRKTRNTSLSTTYVFKRRVVTRIDKIKNAKLLDDYSYDRCGDKFIAHTEHGGSLYMAIKFYFQDSSTRNNFSLGVNTSGGIGDLTASFKSLSDSVRKKMGIEVFYYIEGGSVQALSEAFDSKDFIRCSANSISSCESVLLDIVEYANKRFLKDVQKNPIVTNVNLMDYPGMQQQDFVSIEAQKRKSKLIDLAIDAQFDQSLVEDLIQSRGDIVSIERRKELLKIQSDINQNLNKINRLILACTNRPDECPEPDEVLFLKEYEESRLEPQFNQTQPTIQQRSPTEFRLTVPSGYSLEINPVNALRSKAKEVLAAVDWSFVLIDTILPSSPLDLVLPTATMYSLINRDYRALLKLEDNPEILHVFGKKRFLRGRSTEEFSYILQNLYNGSRFGSIENHQQKLKNVVNECRLKERTKFNYSIQCEVTCRHKKGLKFQLCQAGFIAGVYSRGLIELDVFFYEN